jgi:hypothetical protein
VNVDTFSRQLQEFFSSEFSVERLGDRLACDTPLMYPDGDSVVVYVTEQDGQVEVTDYGEGFGIALGRYGVRAKPVKRAAVEICNGLGVEFGDGRVSTLAKMDEMVDAVWRVASASARIAEATTFQRPDRGREEDVFADEVELALRQREVPVKRDVKLMGDSGHEYHPSLFVPAQELIVEPIGTEVAWNRATYVYAEFGDLRQANSYRLLAVLDDRSGAPAEEVTRLLSQVGDVAQWSRREAWLRRVKGGGNGAQ